MKPNLEHQWALITGASSGIGKEFAIQLAEKKMNLILTARREENLRELAETLQKQHGTKTVILPADLSQLESVDKLISQIRELPDPVSLVVNNAGFGNVATIEQSDVQRLVEMVQVNINVVTRLTYEFLPEMLTRNEGGVINVSSVTAFQPVAYMGVYAASKAYVLHLTESLWAERFGSEVRMLALCPGTTKTDFFDEAGATGWLRKNSAHTPEQVVKKAMQSYEKNRSVCVPGIKNWWMTILTKIVRRRKVVLSTRSIFKSATKSHQTNQD